MYISAHSSLRIAVLSPLYANATSLPLVCLAQKDYIPKTQLQAQGVGKVQGGEMSKEPGKRLGKKVLKKVSKDAKAAEEIKNLKAEIDKEFLFSS